MGLSFQTNKRYGTGSHDAVDAPLTSQLEAANGHRADFESERDRVSRLMPELLRATADTMTAVVAEAF